MPQNPNILVIIPHDLGTHLGCYGEEWLHTPALDGLADEGVRFDQHYCTAAFCSPSRGAIFTGKYPHVNGLMGLVNLGWDLPEGNTLLSQMVRDAGYETFLFGFQHEIQDNERLATLFDHVSDRTGGFSCRRVAPMVADFLRERDNSRPFYARVGFGEVHRSYDRFAPGNPDGVRVPDFLEDTPGARMDFAMFQGAIESLDQSVGQILDALEMSGQKDNTLVVFTTDHGIAFPGAKATLYDPGLRTALLMRWPDGLTSGQVIGEMTSNVDVLPSVLEAIDVSVPQDVQGKSFWPLLKGGDYTPRDWIFAGKNTTQDDIKRCIRTRRYKYIRNYDEGPRLKLPVEGEASLTRRDMGDAHLAPRAPVELYDLERDPLERESLVGRAEVAEVEQELAGLLARFQEETKDPILEGPIKRPPAEAAKIQQVEERKAERVRERDERYPREI